MVDSKTLTPVEEYLALGEKPYFEYLDGVLRQKAMPTFDHSQMELRLSNLINQLAIGLIAGPELTVRLRERRILVPDVGVQRRSELQKPYPTKPIFLCIEILSPDDRLADTVAKCEEYHAWGVPFCWIVDPEQKQCWEYHAGGRPSQIFNDGHLTAEELSLSFADIFAGFQSSETYDRQHDTRDG
jgi:Uma2 family endonuclease